jgi:regulator of cell morphogenesis and NO signaling
MRQASSNYAAPSDACTSFLSLYQALPALEADLHQHIHLENNLLFPRAINLECGV